MESYRPMNELEQKSSMHFWWPVIQKLGIDAPKTKEVPLAKHEIFALASERIPKTVVRKIEATAKEFGTPFFLRTDLSSGKHSWVKTYFVNSIGNLDRHIYEIISHHLLADIFGIPFSSFFVREYIPLESYFTAFWGDMPVAKERRYFIKDSKVQCHHEYWVEGAVREGMERKGIPESDWLPKLRNLNREEAKEVEELSNIAAKVGRHFDGYWSVDFAKAKDGRWLLIDMGKGEISYHKPDCEFAIHEGRVERI